MTRPSPFPWALLALLAAYAVLLAVITWPLDIHEFREVFSERGPFERLSPVLWLLLAAACLYAARSGPRGLTVMSVVCILFAAREADWHRQLAGGNILKLKYYVQNAAPPGEKILAAMVALAAIAILVYALVLAARLLRSRGIYREPWMQTLMVAIAAGVATKLLDRAINVIDDAFDFRIAGLAGRLIGAWEEGFECLLPVLFALALWQYMRSDTRVEARALDKRTGLA